MLRRVPICSRRLLATKTSTSWDSASISIITITTTRRASTLRSLSSSRHPAKAISLDAENYMFGPYKIDIKEVLYSSHLSYAMVNLRPLLPNVPTVSETKANFLQAYKRPIPSIYNIVLQELIVQQRLTKHKRTRRYDAVFVLRFVTMNDRLMEGYPSDEDREATFRAYIKALQEDPEQYRPVYNSLIISVISLCFSPFIFVSLANSSLLNFNT